MPASREDFVEAITSRTGKTREQAEAFLDVVHSGLVRRGWFDGRVLEQDEIADRVHTFLGGSEESQ